MSRLVNEDFVICSNCFKDEGLKLNAIKIGVKNNNVCINCKSTDGYKLNQSLIQTLSYRFFVRGTIERCEYGGYPLIQFNESHFNHSDIDISPWLVDDLKLLEEKGKIGFFYYGPRAWMFGEVEPLKSLQNESERLKIVEKILEVYPIRKLNSEKYFYRIRVNPKIPYDVSEYDSAPDELLGGNRFDSKNFPALYCSQDLEVCIHECRVTVEDNVFVSKLKPVKSLRLLDLSELIKENDVTEFESLDIAIHFLFLAGKNSYEICREIAKRAADKGIDGIIYPSYFSCIRTGTIPFDTIYGISIRRIPDLREYAKSQIIENLVLFGRPLREGKIEVECINKVIINQVAYDIIFGPAYHQAFMNEDKGN